jgi:hypothetical protein
MAAAGNALAHLPAFPKVDTDYVTDDAEDKTGLIKRQYGRHDIE